MRRPTLRLTLSCNNRCLLCADSGLAASAEDPYLPLCAVREQLTALRAASSSSEVTFVGGKPAGHPEITAAVASARELGFSRVGLQSNGRHLADRAFVAALDDAGLTDVQVSLHGAEADIHDYHTDVGGSFDALTAGMATCRARRIDVAVATSLTRSSFRSLAPLPWLLKSRGACGWMIAVPHARGRAASGFARLMPRLGLALPYALHALDAARRLGLPAWIRGAPLCLLGPFASRAVAGESRVYAEPCVACAARAACPGLDRAYLRRFAGDEIAAQETAPPAPDNDHAAIRRMFVGTGGRGVT